MTKKLIILAVFCFFIGGQAMAQAKKITTDPLIWTELQADYFLTNQSFFFFRNQYRHNTDAAFAGLHENGAFSNFYQVFFTVGYDQKFTDHWRGALAARYTLDANNDNRIYMARLQHNGKIGETDFVKRLTLDLMDFTEGESRDRIRPMASLERNFKIKNRIIRPHLSYELFLYNGFREEVAETRTVDRTRLRASVGYQVSKHFWVIPFFIKQTEYFNALSTFSPMRDANGNEVLDDDGNVVLVENKGGKRNRIEPVFGLELRFLFPGRNLNDNAVPNFGNSPGSTDQ